MQTTATRIIEARRDAGFETTTAFAEAIDGLLKRWGYPGISRAAVAQWETGETQNIRPENLVAVSEITGFAIKYIAIGIGPKTEDEKKQNLGAVHEPHARYNNIDKESIELARSIENLPAPTKKLVIQFIESQEGGKR